MILAVSTVLAFASCEKDKYGTDAGNDTDPFIVVSVFSAEFPNDPDCDAVIRVAANNATSDIYLLAESASAKEARGMSDEAYADYVVSNGTKLSFTSSQFDGSLGTDITLSKLYGDNVISAVAVNSKGKYIASESFFGQKWEDVVDGSYTFGKSFMASRVGGTEVSTTLQQNSDNKSNYRFKDLWGAGKHLNISLMNQKGEDEDGVYTFFRVPAQATPFTYGTYGTISVRDVGYWQGDVSWITEGGYESGMYADHSCFIMVQYYVSAGNLGYGYDFFTPDE